MRDSLSTYRRKRDFTATREPSGTRRRASPQTSGTAHFVVQLHHVRARHFDLRLQVGDVLRSWAVPKGPSLDPRKKRLAVQVEDHPLAYGRFEGAIPQGQYGAGTVSIWDEGEWSPQGDPRKALRDGHLRFTLRGHRLQGGWSLIRTRLKGRQPQWLLVKSHDQAERTGDEADDTPLSEWHPTGRRSSARAKSRGRRTSVSDSPRLPTRVELQLARLVDEAPEGDGWLHEVKFDGYRLLISRSGEEVRITSRGDQDWTSKLAALARMTRSLHCDSCILDGELIAPDVEGRSSFGRLQQLFGAAGGEKGMRAMVFDLLHLDGQDLRRASQIERKRALAALMKSARPPLYLTQYVAGNGARSVAAACARGLEGIVSKRADAPYEAGRGGAWLKTKCVQSDEYAIVGYTPGTGARARLGSLLLASPLGAGHWRYRGRVGTGMSERTVDQLLRGLRPAKTSPPLQHAPDRAQLRGARPIWVTPRDVVEVEFRGYTEDGLLRQASLKGLREDRSVKSLKAPGRDSAPVHIPAPTSKASKRGRTQVSSRSRRGSSASEKPAATEVSQVRLTHPERVLFRDPKITKADLAAFYRDIGDFILPGLVNRPQMLLRCPEGASGECFFQKHIVRGFPPAVHEVRDRTLKQSWIYIDDLAGLLGLVQMNTLEFHVWGCTRSDLGHADRIVMDLDPGPDVPWNRVIEAALALRDHLAAGNLQSFVRTTGGKGLHVVVPLQPAVPWDVVAGFARSLAETFAGERPERYVAVASKARRPGRIFVDYLRNARGATAVCSYSLRNRPGAPIATPLDWDELPKVKSGDVFRFGNIGRRLARLSADPWEGISGVRQSLPRASPGR